MTFVFFSHEYFFSKKHLLIFFLVKPWPFQQPPEAKLFQKVRPIWKTLSQDLSDGTLTTKVFLNVQFDIRQFHEKFATVSHLSFLSQVHLSKGRGHNVTGKAKSLIVTAINITHQFVGLSIVPLKIKGKRLAVT